MVFLEHGRVVEAHAVVAPAPAAPGIFLQQPQTRRGFAGVGQGHPRALQLSHQSGRGGSDTGQPHRQVEGGAFPSHQSRRWTIEVQEHLARYHRLPIGHQQLDRHGRIQQLKERFHQHTAAENAGLLGDPRAPTAHPYQGCSREITPAQVFAEPGLQGGPEGRVGDQRGSASGLHQGRWWAR